MTKVEKMILDSAPLQFVFKIAKAIKMPGTEKLSLYEIGAFFFTELGNNKLFVSCAAVTYNFVMAMPPTLLVLFSLIPYLPLQGVQDTIMDTLKLVAHNRTLYDGISSVVTDFMNNQRAEVLSSGILLTVFFASNGMMGLINSFEREHLSVYVKTSGLKQRWMAIKLTLLLLVVAILSIVVLIIQSAAVNDLILRVFENTWVIRVVSILVVTAILYTAISVIYIYGPTLQSKVRFISPGAILATTLCVLTSAVFFFLVDNFIHYNKVYGSIGTLMAFMVWIWLNVLVILIGYDLNVSVMSIKYDRRKSDA